MKQSTKRLLSSALALIFIVAAFIIFFSLIKPAYENTQRLRGEETSRKLFVNEQQKIIEKIKKLISDYQGEKKIQEVASLVLPPNPEVAGALAQLNSLAKTNNLTLQGFSITIPSLQNITSNLSSSKEQSEIAAIISKPVGLLNIQTRFSGSYEDFKTFLKQLETNIRILDISNLQMGQAGKPNQDLYGYDITVVTYYQSR
jgi:Tfp pilus assembly protein PilO